MTVIKSILFTLFSIISFSINLYGQMIPSESQLVRVKTNDGSYLNGRLIYEDESQITVDTKLGKSKVNKVHNSSMKYNKDLEEEHSAH